MDRIEEQVFSWQKRLPILSRTPDARVVATTYRFVNNDGTPDQRFNENTEIPVIEYGLLQLEGSGLDLSLYITDQDAAISAPAGLNEIQELGRKPVRQVAEERRAEAARRRAARKDELSRVIFNAMCCVMGSDDACSPDEVTKITNLMNRLKSPWTADELKAEFTRAQRQMQSDFNAFLEMTCKAVGTIGQRKQQQILATCLQEIAKADGVVEARERSVKQQILDALPESDQASVSSTQAR